MLPIFITKYDEHYKNKEILLEMISRQKCKEIIDEDNDDIISKSDWNVDVGHSREYWNFFYPTIENKYSKLIEDKIQYNGWKIKNYWFQQYETGNVHEWHWHPETFWNSVYYLELPKGSLGTQMKLTWSGDVFTPDVEEGDIITFPSIIKHRSPVITEGRKTVIAFNVE